MTNAKHVVFKVSRPDGHYGLHKIADTVFELGMGPCGRWVGKLEVETSDVLLKIRQHSTPFDITEALGELEDSRTKIDMHNRSRSYKALSGNSRPT